MREEGEQEVEEEAIEAVLKEQGVEEEKEEALERERKPRRTSR